MVIFNLLFYQLTLSRLAVIVLELEAVDNGWLGALSLSLTFHVLTKSASLDFTVSFMVHAFSLN